VRPGDELAITWRSGAAGEMRFECQVDGRSVLAGALRANASGALS
jgi:uncharacterized cupredoxin-like copper-binding protein